MTKAIYILIFFQFCFGKSMAQDEIIGSGQAFQMEVGNLRVVEFRKSNAVVLFDIINTGKADIDLPYNTPLGNIEVIFDDSLKNGKYNYFQYLIKEQLAEEELFLPVGLVKQDYQVEIRLPKEKPKHYEKETKKKKKELIVIVTKDSISNDTLAAISYPKDTILIENQIEIKDSTKKEVVIVDSLQEKKNQNFLEFNKSDLFNLLKKDTTFTFLSHTDTLKVNNQNATKVFSHPYYYELSFFAKDSTLTKKLIGCPDKADFGIDSVFIKEKTKKQVILRFLIRNSGHIAGNLLGETPNIDDNLAIKSYFSSQNKKTNGSIFIRGMYLDDEAKSIDGVFQPAQKLWCEMEIPLKNKTKFTPYIVLEVNGTNTIEECSIDDNFISIKIE